MSGQGPQQKGDEDQEFLKLAVIFIILAILLIAFIATQEYRVNAFIGAVTWLHIAPFAYAAKLVPFLTEIPFIGRYIFGYSMDAMTFLEQGGYAIMDSNYRSSVLTAGGRCATVIYGAVMLWVAFNGREFRVDQKYRTNHNLESMIYLQSENWMTSRLARHVNPLMLDEIDSRRLSNQVSKKSGKGTGLPGRALPRQQIAVLPGTWCRAMRPEEWLISQGLAFDPEHHDRMSSPDRNARTSDFDFIHTWENLQLEEISEALSQQLRNPWTGPESLRPCLRAIFAVMALFYDYKTDEGNALINDLGILNDSCKGKVSTMDAAILAEKGMMARIDKVALGRQGKMLANVGTQHAWAESAFPTFLSFARKDRGVLPAAAFLWLKAEDRRMWYILNNVGNEAVMAEAAGAMAHSRAETQIGKPLRRPAVYQAARALLEDYLDVTPERVASRHQKEVRRRTPGQQIALMRDDALAKMANAPRVDLSKGSEA